MAKLDPRYETVLRRARKEWRCTCADPDSRNYPSRALMCQGRIKPGDEYVEYLGDAGPFGSGTRYCIPCGFATWGSDA